MNCAKCGQPGATIPDVLTIALCDNCYSMHDFNEKTTQPVMEKIQFYGIDGFNRPVFKSLDKQRHFYGDVHNLFGYEATESEVLAKVTVDDLCYFGSRFDCEPYGTAVNNLIIVKKVTQ